MIQRERLEAALQAARDRLLQSRLPEGYWEGRLSSSALSTATAVSALALAAQSQDQPLVTRGVMWLANTQNEDGGWGDTTDSPSNLATSLLGLSALIIAGGATQPTGPTPVAGTPELKQAIAHTERYVSTEAGADPQERVAAVTTAYGDDRTFAVPILANCALAGLASWEHIPGLPFHLAALPQGMYRAVGLQVVSYALPALIAVGLLLDHYNSPSSLATRLVKRFVKSKVRRKLASLQPQHGGFLEATPLTSFVAMSLIPLYGADEPVARKCLDFLRTSVRADGSWPIDTDLSVWVTTSALSALDASGGLGPSDEQRTLEWIQAQQYQQVHPFTGARPGGWSWTHLPGGVPDADDTSGAVLALAGRVENDTITAGVRWLLGLQNSDGGWPPFCRGWGRLPFDRSCPDITAHALRALHGGDRDGPQVQSGVARGLRYLARQQRPDGSWLPLWFGSQATEDRANPVLGTARVLVALAVLDPAGTAARQGLEYLARVENADGGWGGAKGVPSSVEETALAVSALSNWPQEMQGSLTKGVSYLVGRVEDGTWTESAPIGLYFARLWYSEELYPVIWTVEALGRALQALYDCEQEGRRVRPAARTMEEI